MPFTAALTTAAATARAVEEACALAAAHDAGTPDLAVVFFSAGHAPAAGEIAEAIRRRLAPRCLLGCVAEAVIGNDREVEEGPALSLWLGLWSRPVSVESFHLILERTADGPGLLGWPDGLTGADPAQTAVLLLGDPFSFPVDLFLQQVNELSPGVRVLGGMASGVRGPGQCRLVHA